MSKIRKKYSAGDKGKIALETLKGEDAGAFGIGKFGDTRLARIGGLLFKRLFERVTICIKLLGGDHATEVALTD